jgi:hypothetical protein
MSTAFLVGNSTRADVSKVTMELEKPVAPEPTQEKSTIVEMALDADAVEVDASAQVETVV